jgi:hypothetical protein
MIRLDDNHNPSMVTAIWAAIPPSFQLTAPTQ